MSSIRRSRTIGRHRVSMVVRETAEKYGTVESAERAVAWVLEQRAFLSDGRERVLAVYLNTRHEPIGWFEVSIGGRMAAIIDPPMVFRPAVLCSAAGVILLHNHPSGDPTPSAEDHTVTGRIAEAGRVLGIQLFDHIIIARTEWKSFREEGWMV